MQLNPLLFLLAPALAFAAERPLVPFAPPWDDAAPGVTDLRPILRPDAAPLAPVRVRDGHLFAGDRRLRLFGANLTAGACFPDHATAEGVAARMAKFGLNGARLHFLDATWGQPRLIDYASGAWDQWDAEALDRLDYFLAQLKQQGIYWNLNLLVGRAFGAGDGVDPSIRTLDWKAAHAVGFFHAPHMEAQKAFARRLLTHVNPYTKLSLLEDPALAMVEINNENGLLHTWLSHDFENLPEPFAGDLKAQWNAWLLRRHASSTALAAAWNSREEPPGAELLRGTEFAHNAEAWNLEQHHGARATVEATETGVTLHVHQTTTANWHVQWNQPRLAVRKGQLYTVRFRVAADRERHISATVMQAHEPWQALGWQTRLEVGPAWRTYTFTFEADADDDNARFGFSELAQEGALYRFAELSFRPGGRIGLAADERLETRSIRTPLAAGAQPLTDATRRDWIRFLWETEQSHWSAMRHFLSAELGVRVPIVGTIVATSTPHLMADFDLVDTHAYWQHPHFPGRSWDQDHWTVNPWSMVDRPQEATLARLAWQRVAGKPHMVSEYNHPAPNPYAGEGPLLLAAIAALQDWDALFYYTWSHDERGTKAGHIPGFFDIGQHPTIVANLPAAALLFRRGDVAAAKHLVTVALPPARELELIASRGQAWRVVDLEGLHVDLGDAFRHRVALDLRGTDAPATAAVAARDTSAWLADTGEIAWRWAEKDRGMFLVTAPRSKMALGRIADKPLELGHGVRLTAGSTRLDGWCTVSLALLEGEAFDRGPRRALLTATAYTQNTGMVWKDAERRSVGTRWGEAPSLVEPVPLTIAFGAGVGHVHIYPLDARGQRAGPARTAAPDGSFAIGAEAATLWYEVEFAAAR